jgi:catechol 2,3-dioxygenase-like lactoylglutathione lyase family enzyme
MIKRLGHLAIRARDIEKTVQFYREVVGLEEAFRMSDPSGTKLGSVHLYRAPSQFIEIFPRGTETNPSGQHTIGCNISVLRSMMRPKPLRTCAEEGYPLIQN